MNLLHPMKIFLQADNKCEYEHCILKSQKPECAIVGINACLYYFIKKFKIEFSRQNSDARNILFQKLVSSKIEYENYQFQFKSCEELTIYKILEYLSTKSSLELRP